MWRLRHALVQVGGSAPFSTKACLIGFAVLLGWTLRASPTRAQGKACSPQLTISLDVSGDVPACPRAQDVAQWVNTLVGQSVAEVVGFQSATPEGECASHAGLDAASRGPSSLPLELLIRVEKTREALAKAGVDDQKHVVGWSDTAQGQQPELTAFIMSASKASAVSSKADAPSSTPMRELTQRVSCDELLRVAALSISLLINPATPPQSDAVAPPLVALGPESPARESPATEPPTTEPPTTGAPGAGETPASAPANATQLEPSATSGDAPRRENGDANRAISPPRASNASSTEALGPLLQATAQVGAGLNPALNLGGELAIGARVGAWAIKASATYTASTKETTVRRDALTGRVRATTWLFGASPCRTIDAMLEVCATFVHATFAATGRGFDVNYDDTLRFWAVGARSAYVWPITRRLNSHLGLDVLVPLTRIDMRIEGESTAIWEMPLVAARVLWGVEWH